MAHQRARLVTVVTCVLAIGAVGFLLAVAWFQPAHAATSPARWVARGGLLVTEHGVVVKDRLRHCQEEDGSGSRLPCTWNLLRSPSDHPDGNGRGLTYWVDVHRHIHYVWPERPLGHPVDHYPGLADALAEGDRSHWRKCWVDENETHARCPDGYLTRVWVK